MSLPSAADLSRSLDGAGGVVFAVGTLLAAGEGSAFTTRGSRLRLRMKKRKPTFFADTRKTRGKTFWSGDRPCSVGILSTGVHSAGGGRAAPALPGQARASSRGWRDARPHQLECATKAPEKSMNAGTQVPL